MTLSDDQIAAVESAIAAFAPGYTDLAQTVSDLQRACRSYQQLLAEQNPDRFNLQLANLQRINQTAYDRVIKSLPPQLASRVTTFVAKYRGTDLPVLTKPVLASTFKQTSPPIIIKPKA